MSKEKFMILKQRKLEDGLWLVLQLMLHDNRRLSLVEGDLDRDPLSTAFVSNYCYHDAEVALGQFLRWDGRGDPEGWVRHIETGRRRPLGDATHEYINP